MRQRMGTMVAILLFLLSATAEATAGIRRGDVVLEWTGTYLEDSAPRNVTGKCPATGCVGDLVSCDASKKIIITKLTYSYVSLICDDNDDSLPACGGRFTALTEECRGDGDVVPAGALVTLNSAGQIRVCLDGGDCSGPALGTVIATGTIRTQKRSGLGSPSMSGNSSVRRLTRSSFLFEGEQTRLSMWFTLVDDFTAQPQDGNNCDGGCAVMGLTIRDLSQ